MDSIGLYIHFPFCQSKCNYCDFNSYSGKNSLIQPYIDGLLKEMEVYSNESNISHLKSIFIGGGTPSIMEGSQVELIVEGIYKYFRPLPNIEITLEGNPGTLSAEKLRSYRGAGINRLSMGLQACQQQLLERLGRIHTYNDFLNNLMEAKKHGFNNINVDLMMGLPGQSLKDWQWTLGEITSLGIPHISAYSLIWEEGTAFYASLLENRLQQLDEAIELEMYHFTMDYLKSKGYNHYEISNYALDNYRCNHNIIYWKNQNYLGLGAGAHSHIKGRRFSNEIAIEGYIDRVQNGKSPIVEEVSLTREDEISETMFLGLRMLEGIKISDFIQRFGVSPGDIYGDRLLKLVEQDLLEISNDRIKLTKKGLDLGNVVFSEMIIEKQ